MIPGNSLVVTCPHCGGKKELLQLMSGNTFGATLWSDLKQTASMLPRVSPVQKCPECGHYYLLSRLSSNDRGTGKSVSFETGWLSFDEALEANKEIKAQASENPSFIEKLKTKIGMEGIHMPLSNYDLETLAAITIWAYNDIIRDGKEPTTTQKSEFIHFVSNILANKELFAYNPIFVAELHREIGNFDECINIISEYKSDNEGENTASKIILDLARSKNCQVCQIQFDDQR